MLCYYLNSYTGLLSGPSFILWYSKHFYELPSRKKKNWSDLRLEKVMRKIETET